MPSLQRKVAIVGLARLAASGAAVLVNIALARGLDRALNGAVQEALIVSGIAILLGQSGIQTSCYTFLPRMEAGRRRAFFAQSTGLLLALGAMAAAAIWLMAPWLAREMGNPHLDRFLAILAGYVFFTIAASATEAALLTHERHIGFLAGTLAWAALHSGGVIALLWLGQPIEWILGVLTLAAAARFIGFLLLAWRSMPPGDAAPNRALLWTQIAFIAPLAAQGALDVTARWLDRSLIALLYEAEQVAVYTYGALEIPFVGILMGAILPVLLPELSAAWGRGDRQRVLDLWGRATVRTAAVLLPLCFFLMPMARPFLDVLYKRYSDSTPYFQVYLLLLPIRVIAFTPMLFALGRSGWVLAGACVDVALNFALSVWLIPRLGMLGPTFGTVAATWVQAFTYLCVIRMALGAGWAQLLPWRRLGAVIVEAGAVSLPLYALARMQAPPIVSLGLGAGLFGAWAALRLRKLW